MSGAVTHCPVTGLPVNQKPEMNRGYFPILKRSSPAKSGNMRAMLSQRNIVFWGARIKFVKSLRGIRTAYGMPKASFIIGGNRIVRTAVKTLRKRLGTRMIFVHNLDEVPAMVRQMEDPSLPPPKTLEDKPGEPCTKCADEVIDFIGSFTWDSPEERMKDIDPGHQGL